LNSLAIDPGDVCIVRLNAQKLTELIDLQNEVSARLIMPEFYAAVADAKLEELLGEDGLCFGAEHAGRLVGFFGVLFVGEREENVGRDIGLPPQELSLVAYFKAVFVLPEYRKIGLQRRMFHALFSSIGIVLPSKQTNSPVLINNLQPTSIISGLPPIKWLCATVSPHNETSLRSFIDWGFCIGGLKPKDFGWLRYLVVRRFESYLPCLAEGISVALHDYKTQIDLLSRGWVGTKLENSNSNPYVYYTHAKGL